MWAKLYTLIIIYTTLIYNFYIIIAHNCWRVFCVTFLCILPFIISTFYSEDEKILIAEISKSTDIILYCIIHLHFKL